MRTNKQGPETPVKILQYEWEFLSLLDIYKKRKPKKVLEIGSFAGGTLYHWLQNATVGTHIISVDTYVSGEDNRSLYDSWKPRGVTLTALCGDSHSEEIKMQLKLAAPFDWVFIDADHYYDSVKQDWSTYKEMCSGVLVLHDINPIADPSIEVDRLWGEIRRDGYVIQELLATNESCGIGVVYLESGTPSETLPG